MVLRRLKKADQDLSDKDADDLAHVMGGLDLRGKDHNRFTQAVMSRKSRVGTAYLATCFKLKQTHFGTRWMIYLRNDAFARAG